MKIVAVVAPNGLGHFRRTVNVLARLCARLPDLRVDLVCESWQVARGDWAEAKLVLERGRAITGVMSPGVEWSGRGAGYDEARLLGWVDRLRAVPELLAADLVLSDNLAGVLAVRPDAVLMGSFLWSDVLAALHADGGARAFVLHERALLVTAHPPMLCISDLAMPGVLARTAAVPLPWMCAPAPELAVERAEPPTIAVLGGTTGAADAVLDGIEAALREAGHGRWDIVSADDFGHSAEDFAICSAVVCRPGVGTLTDCVATATPMLWAYEPGNAELAHNAAACAALGLGIDLGADAAPADAAGALATLLQAAPDYHARLLARPRDGLDRAADWLLARLGVPPLERTETP